MDLWDWFVCGPVFEEQGCGEKTGDNPGDDPGDNPGGNAG